MRFLLVGAGGFLGAMARYAVGLLVTRAAGGELPFATFLVNVSGCFVLGFVMASADLEPAWRLLVATGFVGAYTTFSTFAFETDRLAATGALAWAVVNVAASVLCGLLAVRLGAALAH
jgi:CrcB protein